MLRLAERPALPSRAHVLVELGKHVDTHLVAQNTLLKAEVDGLKPTSRSTATSWPTRPSWPSAEPLPPPQLLDGETLPLLDGRIFAASTADEGETWPPFAKKTYVDGTLRTIDMPPAEIGFAVASHHLWLAEGTRQIWLQVGPEAPQTDEGKEPPRQQAYLRCRLTTATGWLEKSVDQVTTGGGGVFLALLVDPNDPPITPYDAAVHGYAFATAQPVLLVTLRHPDDAPWSYPLLAGTAVSSLTLTTRVDGIRTLALANDQGPIDATKPFLAFGSTPTSNSALVVGSKEAFQKKPDRTWLSATLMAKPVPHGNAPTLSFDYLDGGTWTEVGTELSTTDTSLFLEIPPFPQPPVTNPDLTPNAAYTTTSRGGFIRMKLNGGYGTDTYPVALAAWVAKVAKGSTEAPPTAPVLPVISSLTLGYAATQTFALAAPTEATGRFFHVAPFGHRRAAHARTDGSYPRSSPGPAKRPSGSSTSACRSSPRRRTSRCSSRWPTAPPTRSSSNPSTTSGWSYLRGDEWAALPPDAVNDLTEGLLASGIVTLAVPADASTRPHPHAAGNALDPDRGGRRHRRRVPTGQRRRAGRAAPRPRVPDGAATVTVDLPAGTISKLDAAGPGGEGGQPALPRPSADGPSRMAGPSPPGSASGCGTRTGPSRCGTTST